MEKIFLSINNICWYFSYIFHQWALKWLDVPKNQAWYFFTNKKICILATFKLIQYIKYNINSKWLKHKNDELVNSLATSKLITYNDTMSINILI